MLSIIIGPRGGLEHLQTKEQTVVDPAPSEVRVRWRATSLNYHDYLVATGGIPVPEGRVPMSDGAGEVEAVGEGVTRWAVGDRVMSLFFPDWVEGRPRPATTRAISGETADGFLTQSSCVSAESLTRVPTGYTFAEAATLPCAALTAWRALMVEGKLRLGDKVLIEGTGGMSIFALQFALAAGAEVYATTSSPEKVERLRDMGVAGVVNYRETERWGRAVYQMSGGGVDHVLDVGGGTTMEQSIDAAAMNGHVTSIGLLGDGRKGAITFPKLFFKHLRITGLAVGSRRMQQDMVRAIEHSGLKPQVDRRFGFHELVEAFRYQQSGRHFGKIVLEW